MPRFTGIQFGGTSAGERTACDIADELNCVKRSEGGDETLKSNVVKVR